METIDIACRCGAVHIEVSAPPIAQMYCHCDDCQVVHGAAYVPESVYRADAVKVIRGEPSAWKLKRNPRMTCSTCGTRLFIDVLALGLRGVNGYLLPAGMFTPTFHMHCRCAIRPVRDDLPHFASRPARFGGTDETVDW
jgi:Glutathione-dependent formaldehyde-activating enzyme